MPAVALTLLGVDGVGVFDEEDEDELELEPEDDLEPDDEELDDEPELEVEPEPEVDLLPCGDDPTGTGGVGVEETVLLTGTAPTPKMETPYSSAPRSGPAPTYPAVYCPSFIPASIAADPGSNA